MKILPLLPATFLLLLVAGAVAPAQSVRWEPFGGPEGGNVLSMARNPDGTIFATLDARGIFRSSNDGVSWERLGADPGPRWSALVDATSTGTLLLNGSDSLLRRSTDGGASWTVVSDRLDRGIHIVEDSAGGLIAAGRGGLYRSSDDGATWNRHGTAIEETIGALAIGSDGRIVAAVQEGFSPRGVRVSTDMGATWRLFQIGDSNTPTVLSLAATATGGLLAGTGGGGLYRSDDGGATWILTPLEKPVYYSAILVLRDGSIVTSAGGWGIQRSEDGGVSWSWFGPSEVGLQTTALGTTGDGRLLAGTYSSGIYEVEPQRWTKSSRGLPRLGIVRLVFAPDGPIYTIATDARFYTSLDNGTSWIDPGTRRAPTSVIAVDSEGRIIAGDFRFPDYGIAISTDRGATWERRGLEGEKLLAVLIDRNDDLYAGVERGNYTFHSSFTDGLFHSTDLGVTWTALGSGLQGVSPASIVALEDGTLFIGAEYGERVFRLSPGDTLWRNMSAGLPLYRYPLLLTGLVADRAGNLYAGMVQGLFRSSDRGESWQSLNTALGDTTVTAIGLSPAGTIIVATRRNGVHASVDNGITWRRHGDPPTSTAFDVIAFDSTGALVAGNQEGLFRAVETSLVGLPEARIDAALVATPNPAGSHIRITFEMASSGSARLALHDALGREVALLLDGIAPKGLNRIDLDCSRQTSGRYTLQLETAVGRQEIGVVLVR